MGIARLVNYIVANTKEKTVACLIISLFLASPVLSAIIPAYALPDENYTYASATVKIVRSSINGDYTIYSTIKLGVPQYIIVDREVKIRVEFSRSACSVDQSLVITIGARINTTSGGKEYDLSGVKFSLDCKTSNTQEQEVSIVIPKTLYEESVDKIVTFYVSKVTPSPDMWIKSVNIVSNIPSNAYLVNSVPEPVISVKNINIGYLNLTVGEARDIIITLTSKYAPIIVENVSATLPGGFAAYVNTPLPLNIGANKTKQITITIRGVRPAAGFLLLNIYYYTGAETKKLSIYIPVICEEKKIYQLIDQYKQELGILEQNVHRLEEQIGIKISTINNLTKQIEEITVTLNKLVPLYVNITKKINFLEDEINSASQASTTSDVNLNNIEISKIYNSLNRTLSELNTTRNRMQRLERAQKMLSASIIVLLIILIAILYRSKAVR